MEVDGRVNVINADNDMVSIKVHDTWNQIHNQLENISGEMGGGKIIAVVDSKWKRVEENVQGEIITDNIVLDSKNGQPVGYRLQAHQSL